MSFRKTAEDRKKDKKFKKAQQLINSLNEDRIARETRIEELKRNLDGSEEPQRELVGLKKGREVIIQPPQVRTIRVEIYTLSGFRTYKYRLSFPYVIFIKNNWEISVAMSNKPLTSVDDPVYWLPLPNIWSTLHVCTGDYGSELRDLDDWVASFWGSKFVPYHGGVGNAVRGQYLLSFRQWALKTKRNPNFIFKIKWPKVCRVADMMKCCDHPLNIPFSFWRNIKLWLFYSIF
jgi:hypothetical protein